MNHLLKWWQTFQIGLSKQMAYRSNFVLQVLGPAIVFFFVKFSLWKAIYAPRPDALIQGYSFDQMINYHIWALITGMVASGHAAMDLAQEIRMGKISTYLIYPFNFWEFHTANFFSFQAIQLFISIITLSVLSLFGLMTFPSLSTLFLGLFYCLFVSLFWFSLQYFTGVLGFWLEETWILRVILMIISGFLSGAIIPLDLFPLWAQETLSWTPFPYLTYFAIKIFQGDNSHMISSMGIMSFWMIVVLFLNRFVWKRGIKLYTAAGM